VKVIFSPHCDDAYLSLGGSILLWRDAEEEVRIVNCFSKSGASRHITVTKGKVVDLITHTRALEETVNALSVGAQVEFLGLPESQLRGYTNTVGEAKGLRGRFAPKIDDSWIPPKLEDAIMKHAPDNHLYFPLGLGNHHDHVLVAKAGKEANAMEKNSVTFYEDLPYAAQDQYRRINEDMTSTLTPISWTRKAELLGTYESQFPGRYGKRIMTMIEEYCKSIGNAERTWKSPPPSNKIPPKN